MLYCGMQYIIRMHVPGLDSSAYGGEAAGRKLAKRQPLALLKASRQRKSFKDNTLKLPDLRWQQQPTGDAARVLIPYRNCPRALPPWGQQWDFRVARRSCVASPVGLPPPSSSLPSVLSHIPINTLTHKLCAVTPWNAVRRGAGRGWCVADTRRSARPGGLLGWVAQEGGLDTHHTPYS